MPRVREKPEATLHERRRALRMRDPEFRESYERASREIAQTDAAIRTLDRLRIDLGMSKAELARRIGRNPSSIRRLFTANHAQPEFSLVAAIADAVEAEVRVVPRLAVDQVHAQPHEDPKRKAAA